MSSSKKCAVFCASSFDPQKKYLKEIQELIRALSKKFQIVYGGSNTGYMKAVAQEVIDNKGYLIGVMPKFLEWKELRFNACHEWIETLNMNDRKEKIIEMSDFFVALPGGVGTYEEVIDVLSWKHIGLINKPLVLYNLNNFFDGLIIQIDKGIEDGFILESLKSSFLVSEQVDEIMNYLLSESQDEQWDILDENRKLSAKVINAKNANQLKPNEFHLKVNLIVRNNDKILLLKTGNYELVETTVRSFETSRDALNRLAKEKLNLNLNNIYLEIVHQETSNQTHIDYYEINNLTIEGYQYYSFEEVLEFSRLNQINLNPLRMTLLFPQHHSL